MKLHIFTIFSIFPLVYGLDVFTILKNFRISFDDNLLIIKPVPKLEYQIEIENGYLHGIKNGSAHQKVITGFHFTESTLVENTKKLTDEKTIKFETVTCSQLSPMLGRYILQEILKGLKFDEKRRKDFDVCAFRVSVKDSELEKSQMYMIKFSKGVLEAKFNLGDLDTVVAEYIKQHIQHIDSSPRLAT